MNEELTEEYFKANYADILCRSPWTGEPVDGIHLDVNKGWWPLIDELCKNIKEELDNNLELVGKVYAVQVKEKFGGLRFYLSAGTEKILELVDKAECKSYETCETCGQPGKLRTDLSWQLTLCDEHYEGEK
jgi:hypothetical protein